jgi:hypothetical protein
MGRKSTAKTQSRQTGASGSGTSNPPPRSRSFPPLLIVAIVLALAAGLTIYFRGVTVPDQAAQNAGAALAQTPVDAPAAAKLGPHPQENLPPLPFMPEPPARPMEVVRASYKFAAEHPEVLSYVPCYCGCERSGHRGNEDCFVTRRDEKNDVVEWEPHGMT